jgi:hypothetical protein
MLHDEKPDGRAAPPGALVRPGGPGLADFACRVALAVLILGLAYLLWRGVHRAFAQSIPEGFSLLNREQGLGGRRAPPGQGELAPGPLGREVHPPGAQAGRGTRGRAAGAGLDGRWGQRPGDALYGR